MSAPTSKPRCFLVYALAPVGLSPAEANRAFNEFVADLSLPLVLFHDHFIGQAGGIAIFFVETPEERRNLFESRKLEGWRVEVQPLIFSRNPAAFDEQIAFTLRAYRAQDWEAIQQDRRPVYGDPRKEAQTAAEGDDHLDED